MYYKKRSKLIFNGEILMSKESQHLAKILKVPCPHEAGLVSTSKEVPDYYPLSYDEMRGLIKLAFNQEATTQLKTQVQVRLGQAVENMVCPHPIDGPVAQKLANLDRTFVDCVHSGNEALAIKKIGKILSLTN